MANKQVSELPMHIVSNLRHPARSYQIEALKNWQQYLQQKPEPSIQVLFNMATGSGKTYIMAALMLDLFRRGRRNFVFFVNSTNILEKSRDNFVRSGSAKYLFADHIMIDGQNVQVREITHLSESDSSAINIIFTTTQRLHADLKTPHENRLTFDELAQYDLVLIGDEAHHNNVNSSQARNLAESKNWEATVAHIIKQNPHTILLEFTATMDFEDAAIERKYAGRTIFRYGLREFRQDGFSKDVMLYVADEDLERRELAAIILSQYRKYVAAKYQIPLKPVVMFKSRTVYENKNNFDDFRRLILVLVPELLQALDNEQHPLLGRAFQFFREQGIDYEALCYLLREDFQDLHLLRIDGGQSISVATQQVVNTLEQSDNFCRAIFAVDMLKEGWDVLNLFDIVRLYDTHDGKNQNGVYLPGKTTISEAQLIGRGARYYPFSTHQADDMYRRKFDLQPNHELRILEQLHYHTKHNVRYIEEIKSALDQTGITDFANHDTVARAPRSAKPSLKTRTSTIPGIIAIDFDTGPAREVALFEATPANPTHHIQVRLGDFAARNQIIAAMNRHPFYNYRNLQALGFTSRRNCAKQIENCVLQVNITTRITELDSQQKIALITQALGQIISYMI